MNSVELRDHYLKLYKLHGDAPEAMQYSSKESQYKRFKILCEIADLSNKTVLDFGCGTGHLGEYLRDHDIVCGYNGTDIVPDFLQVCQKKFPDGSFQPFESSPSQTFDFCIVSGVFNNRTEDNLFFLKETVKTLFTVCKLGISFNVMSKYVDYEDPTLFYAYPEDIFSFIKTEVSPFVTLRNDYLVKSSTPPFDFTVYIYKGGR